MLRSYLRGSRVQQTPALLNWDEQGSFSACVGKAGKGVNCCLFVLAASEELGLCWEPLAGALEGN